MIELLFTAAIVWTTQKDVSAHCSNNLSQTPLERVGGCYVHDTNTIYMPTKLPKGLGKDFVLYHEVGHSLYWMSFPREIFKPTPFDPDYEGIADDFAWWMYAKKHPKERKFMESVIVKPKRDFFAETCAETCVEAILKLKTK